MAANDEKLKKSLRARLRAASGYKPVRKPRLRGATATQPPPIPSPAVREAEFGEAAEDGLRMLAALETMESLEPDFCGDLVTEASVTIIERADTRTEPEEGADLPPAGSLRARIGDLGEAPDIDPDEHAAYQGGVEEAIVEIVEVAPVKAVASPPAGTPVPLPLRLKKARQAHRFFKALTGGSG